MVERSILGIPPIIPLDPEAFKESLGPAYKSGYFGSGGWLGDRYKSKFSGDFFFPGKKTAL